MIGVKPEETKQSVWLGRCIQEFKFALNAVDPNEMP